MIAAYTPPKLISRAPGSIEPKGSGSVTVQVLVASNGSVKGVRVIKSTNSGDNAAALDIARHSEYAPGSRNGRHVETFYDFIINFGAKVVSGAAGEIDALLHHNQWDQAKSAATTALASNPNDALVQAQLGVADAFTHDISGAASAFNKAGTIPPQYADVAAQVYALDAPSIASKDADVALAEAKKAVALSPSYSSYYALGFVQASSGDSSTALATLQKAQSMADAATPAADLATKEMIGKEILFTDLALKDTSAAQQEAAALDAMDPSQKTSGKVMAYYYDQRGVAAENARNADEAVAMYEKAAQADPSWAGGEEYTKAAIVLISKSIPDYLKAKAETDKAISDEPNYALAYFVQGVALAKYALDTANENDGQDADVALRHAADLAQSQNDPALAKEAIFFEQNHTIQVNRDELNTLLPSNGINAGGMTQGM